MSKENLSAKIKELRELQVFIKQLEEEADAVKFEIIKVMQDENTDTIQTDIFTVKYTEYQSTRIDTSAFKKEYPEIAERFTKTNTARRFSIA